MAAHLSQHTVKNITWVVLGVLCLLLALVFAVSQSKKEVEVVEIEQQAQDAARPVQIEKVAMDVNLGALTTEVPPLMLKQREINIADHAKEFRGSKFLTDNKKLWTYEILQAEEEDVIRTFLNQRDDRGEFQYFRLENEGKPTKFVLTYGKAKSTEELKSKIGSLSLNLPDSIKPKIVTFAEYEKFVNDLGTDEISTGLKLKPVNLTKAPLPVVIERPRSTPSSSSSNPELSAGTTTTIRQTDPSTQQQKVQTESSRVPAQQPAVQEQRSAPAKPQASESQIIDPF